MTRHKAVFNWSGGKDSAHALWRAMRSERYEIVALLTTVNRSTLRSTMHGIPTELLRAQADRIGIPLHTVDLTPKGDMEDYSAAMDRAVRRYREEGVTHFIFGDIFLHDVRTYREKQLAPYGIEVIEPLWGRTSGQIMEEFLASGLETVIVTTTADVLGREFIGRRIDAKLVADLPEGVDPCGENGEYHTFCYGGGMFRTRGPFTLGAPMQQSYPVMPDDGTERFYTYWFADLNA